MAQNAINDFKSFKAYFSEVQERFIKISSICDEFFDIQSQIEELEIVLKETSTADQGITFDKEFHIVLRD